MGKVLAEIGEREASFIAKQKVFFVATAPLSPDHHVSVSPKAGGGSCVVLDPHTVAYADLTGSGAETAAHVLQNQRMTLMFCNLENGPPKILRLFGKARVILPQDLSRSLRNKFPGSITTSHGFRAVYKLQVTRVSSSCGYSLPVMEFQKYRSTLEELTSKNGKKGMFDYSTLKNSFSIDGLPSLALLRKDAPKNIVPVAEDGYFYGRSGSDAGSAASAIHAKATTNAKQLHSTRPVGHSIRLSLTELSLAMALFFLLGWAFSVAVVGHLSDYDRVQDFLGR